MRFVKKSNLKSIVIFLLVILLCLISYHEKYFNKIYELAINEKYDYKDNNMYERRLAAFSVSDNKHFDYVFVGDSLTDYFNWSELDWGGVSVAERGIAGDTSEGLLNRIGSIVSLSPDVVFIMIGTNDLTHGIPIEDIVDNYKKIFDEINHRLPGCIIYFESVLPTNEAEKNTYIIELNRKTKELVCSYKNIYYIDMYDVFCDSEGLLRDEYTIEGLHLTSLGYSIWVDILKTNLSSL